MCWDIAALGRRQIQSREKNNKEHVEPHGTQGWISPELYDSDTNDYDLKVDIFPLGCVFGYTLSGGKYLFGDSLLEQAVRILHKRPMTLVLAQLKNPFCNDRKIFELIESMVKMDPKDRPSSYAVLNNPFFLECDTSGNTNRSMLKVEANNQPEVADVLKDSFFNDKVINIDFHIEIQ